MEKGQEETGERKNWKEEERRVEGGGQRPVNNGRVGRIYKELMGSKEIIAKDRKSNGGKDKGKGKMERANVKGLLSGTPGSNGLSVHGDEMRTSHR